MNSCLNLSIVNNSKDFFSLREKWNNLLELSDSNTIFLRWEWLYHWWFVYGSGSNQLYIIIVRDNDQLLGIAPLYIKRGRLPFLSKINFLGSNIICSEYLDFILHKDRKKEALFSILSFLQDNKQLWAALKLTDIPSDSLNLPLIKSFFRHNRIIINNYTVCHYIKLTSSWDSIYDSYASNLKNTIRRKMKKLGATADSGFYEVTSDDDLDSCFLKLVHLNKLRLEKRNIRSPFCEEKFLIFHQNTIKELYKKGKAELRFVKSNGKLIAGIYLLHYNNKYYFYQSGLDPDWEWLSPGTLLFDHCIKSACENGAEEFDFLQGNEEYKSSWTKTKRTNLKVAIYSNTMKGCLFRLLDYSMEKLKNIVKSYFLTMLYKKEQQNG